MKKRKTFFIAVTLVIFAVISAGCGNKQKQSDSGEKTTFTYWVNLPSQIATKVSSFNDVEMYKQREADTGIHIDFIHPAQGQAVEQFNLMVASDDLPDMIEYNWLSYSGGPQKAIDDEIIIALNDYIDKYAPNFKKTVTDKNELSPYYDKGSKTDSGEYFSFPNLNTGTARTFAGPLVRKDWLDELGLEVPETIDDWETMLRAFKNEKNVKTPFTAVNQYFTASNSFNGAWNVGQRLYVENGKVKYGPLENGYREYIAKMRQWYAEGLIDKDYSTNQRSVVDAKMTNGDSGATFFNLGAALGIYLKQMQTRDPNYNLVCAPYPVLKKGDRNDFYASNDDVDTSFLAITTSCEDPVTAVKWADFWYSDEGYDLMNFGVEGKTYNMVDGKHVYTDEILHNPDNLSINEALSLHCRATGQAPGFHQAPEYLEQYYEFPQQVDGFKLWSANIDNIRPKLYPATASPTSDELEEIASLETNINTYVEEMCLKFVTGAEPMENYDKFLEELRTSFNIERYLEIKQKMYERYSVR